MKLSAYHPTYNKILPFKPTKVKNPSQYFRITADENAVNHSRYLSFYWPRFRKYIKQIPVDFGTARAVNQPVYCDRALKRVSASRNAGNFAVYEWTAPSGNIYAMCIVHCKDKKLSTNANDAFCKVAPSSENGGYVPHTHLAFAVAYGGQNPQPIHYSKVLF